jgi:hypothetical protein
LANHLNVAIGAKKICASGQPALLCYAASRIAASNASVSVIAMGLGHIVSCDRKDIEADSGCQDDRGKGKPHLPLHQFVL